MIKKSDSQAQRLARVCFERGISIKQAASELGHSERQAYRLSASDAFKNTQAMLRRAALNSAISLLAMHTETAIDTLIDVLGDDETPASTRVSGAKAVLDSIVKLAGFFDIESRVCELESLVERQGIEKNGTFTVPSPVLGSEN